MDNNIRVLKIIRTVGSHKVKAYVDVKIGDWTVFDWRIIQQGPGQPLGVDYPQVTFRDKRGSIKYRALLSLPGHLRQLVELQILLAWNQQENSGEHDNRSNK